MASNGLVANPKKTVFLMLNNKSKTNLETLAIKVGEDVIKQEAYTKLLGLKIEENQKWNIHCKELTATLNSRLFQIRRIKNQVPKRCIMRIVQSLWFSKLRYGLQIIAQTRLKEKDPSHILMDGLQIAQNRMLRLLHGSTLKDRISTEELLRTANVLSVNQLATEVKLTECWKAANIENYSVKMDKGHVEQNVEGRQLRSSSLREFKDHSRTKIGEESFHISTGKAWNNAPQEVKETKTIFAAKRMIKKYCKTLPI